jgi:hypothetical protein
MRAASQHAVTQSVMEGHGYYGHHSAPQHAAASVAYPYLSEAAAEVPVPTDGTPLTIGDFGCAGGANEMEPMALAIDVVRDRSAATPIEVAHTDLPQNDFGPLFELLSGPDGYPAGRDGVYPFVIGRTLYGPLLPDRQLHVGWSGITLHWLSEVPAITTEDVYPNLVRGAARDALRQRAASDWHVFLTERGRELVDDGELVLVAGASQPDGASGAEALFRLIREVLDTMVADGQVRPSERAKIFYPTWNRTPEEWLAPVQGALADTYELVAHRLDASDDSTTYPQYRRDGDATAFAAAYVQFVRAVTEHPFFRWLEPDRDEASRSTVTEGFYDRLQAALCEHPEVAAVWHVMSLRLRRRRRP